MIWGGGNSKPKPFISSAFKEDSNPYFDSDFFKLIFFFWIVCLELSFLSQVYTTDTFVLMLTLLHVKVYFKLTSIFHLSA